MCRDCVLACEYEYVCLTAFVFVLVCGVCVLFSWRGVRGCVLDMPHFGVVVVAVFGDICNFV